MNAIVVDEVSAPVVAVSTVMPVPELIAVMRVFGAMLVPTRYMPTDRPVVLAKARVVAPLALVPEAMETGRRARVS